MDTGEKYPYFLSVVVPCYNEEERVYGSIVRIVHTLETKFKKLEVICVNDGSTDNTAKELFRLLDGRYQDKVKVVSYSENRGKGHALTEGVKETSGDLTAFLDADLELAPELLFNFMQIMRQKNADVVIGSKMHKDSKIDYPVNRRIMSIGYYLLLKLLFRLEVKDTQTGIKLFKTELIKEAMRQVRVKGFAFDIEVLVICNKHKAKIVDAPITLNFSREHGIGRIRLRDIFVMFKNTLEIFGRLHFSKAYK